MCICLYVFVTWADAFSVTCNGCHVSFIVQLLLWCFMFQLNTSQDYVVVMVCVNTSASSVMKYIQKPFIVVLVQTNPAERTLTTRADTENVQRPLSLVEPF